MRSAGQLAGCGFDFPRVGGWWHSRDVKRRRVIVILAGCLVCAVVVVAIWPGEREPEYKGKKLSEWVTGLAIANFPDRVPNQTAAAIRHFGTNANPYLLRWIRYEQPTWKRKLSARYTKWPFLLVNNSIQGWLLGVREERLIQAAIVGFGVLGGDAAPAVPDLTQLMRSTWPQPAMRATVALAFIGKAGFPPLEAALTNRAAPFDVRICGLSGIILVGTNDHRAVSALMGALEDSDYVVRREATNALQRIAPEVLENEGSRTNWNFRHEK
jgi:hypothetical protein